MTLSLVTQSVHIHPTAAELIPTVIGKLQTMEIYTGIAMDNQGGPAQHSLSAIDAFGGLAAAGVNAHFRKTQQGVTITRSPWDLAFVSGGLLGFALAPLYILGADEVSLVLRGDFGGERLYFLIFELLILVVAVLFVKSSLLRRPIAKVSILDRSISYNHLGYANVRIDADNVQNLCVRETRAVTTSPGEGRRTYYAVSVNLRVGNAVDIATHKKLHKMQDLANAVAKILSIDIVDPH